MNEVNTLILGTNNQLIDLNFIRSFTIPLYLRTNYDLTDH